MRIDSVDFFYLAMPTITTEADGSQDALLVRVSAGGHIGWGECEAAPLPSIAAFVCPMSHGVCRPLADSVLGARINDTSDIAAISTRIGYDSMDLLQAPHTLSGIEMALWDLLGKARGEPAFRLAGYRTSHAKTPYASTLFGDTPDVTRQRAIEARKAGFKAAKFGWGPIGTGTVAADADQFMAAREGLGRDGILLVDVGQVFGADVDRAALRLPALEDARAVWFEEPFQASAYEAYGALARQCKTVKLAGGEGAHNIHMARHLMDYGGVGFVQIDAGRIGGIGPSKEVCDMAMARGVTYVNHTFTSHLALSASLQPYAGWRDARICEYPVAPKPLSLAFVETPIAIDGNGEIAAPDRPGLGVDIDIAAAKPYLLEVEIQVSGKVLYRTPDIG